MRAMKLTLAIAWREFLDKKIVVMVSMICAVIPFLMPLLLPWVNGYNPNRAENVRNNLIPGMAVLEGQLMALALAVVLGGTLFGRDFAERRIGFFFSRPIPSGVVWAGKMLAGIGLIVTVLIVPMIPLILLGYDFSKLIAKGTTDGIGLFLLAAGVALFAFCLYVAVPLRSKSRWIFVDLAMLPACLALAMPAVFRLRVWEHNLAFGLWGVGGILAVGAVGASLAGVVFGRTDIRRVHRAMAMTFWPVALVGVGLFEGYAVWVFSPTPGDVLFVENAVAAPRSTWIAVAGPARGRDTQPSFLYDTASGRYIRCGAWKFEQVSFSDDGKHAAWIEPMVGVIGMADLWDPTGMDIARRLGFVSLDDPSARPRYSTIPFKDVKGLALSPDGSRIAVLAETTVTVVDGKTGYVIAKTPAEKKSLYDNASMQEFFASRDRFLVIAKSDKGQPFKVKLQDGSTDKTLAVLDSTGLLEDDFQTTSDGRFVRCRLDRDKVSVAVWSHDGDELDRFEIDVRGSEISRLKIQSLPFDFHPESSDKAYFLTMADYYNDGKIFEIDLAARKIVKRFDWAIVRRNHWTPINLQQLNSSHIPRYFYAPFDETPETDGVRRHQRAALVSFDPDTGETRTIFPIRK